MKIKLKDGYKLKKKLSEKGKKAIKKMLLNKKPRKNNRGNYMA